MGRISEFACPSCDMSWEVWLGHGMGHATIESVLDAFPEDIRKRILADTKDEQFPLFEFNYCPAVCRHCQKIVAVPVLHLPRRGQTYTAACPECGNPADVLAEDSGNVCPYCGKGVLSAEDINRWD